MECARAFAAAWFAFLMINYLSGDLHPGAYAVIDHGKGHPADTWVGPDGQVFTSVQIGSIGQDELYRWQVTDDSGTTLEAVDLGPLCIDDFWGPYGTCTR